MPDLDPWIREVIMVFLAALVLTLSSAMSGPVVVDDLVDIATAQAVTEFRIDLGEPSIIDVPSSWLMDDNDATEPGDGPGPTGDEPPGQQNPVEPVTWGAIKLQFE